MNTLEVNRLFSLINLDLVETFIAYEGWTPASTLGEHIVIWKSDIYPNDQIVLPNSDQLTDSSRRIFDAVSVLSDTLSRPVKEILNEIQKVAADVVQIRVEHTDVEGGTIPLDDGVLLFEKARELVTSGVRSTIEKKRYYSGRLSDELTDFIKSMKFGQTEYGSYAVNVIVPIGVSQDDQQDLAEQSFTRTVSTNLSKGLIAIHDAVISFKDTNNFEVFENSVEEGVSANLCDALIGLSGSSMGRNISIRFSLGNAESSGQFVELEHKFESTSVPHLQAASDYFKNKYQLENYTISGYVTKLHHEENEAFGDITIGAIVNGRGKAVSLQLNQSQYWEAHAAHKSKKPVECTGNLLVTPRSARLVDLSHFRVFGNEDLLLE